MIDLSKQSAKYRKL